jgi:hypothetical protein
MPVLDNLEQNVLVYKSFKSYIKGFAYPGDLLLLLLNMLLLRIEEKEKNA